MNKYNLILISSLVLIIIFGCVSCGVTKDIYIGSEYPNFVKEDPVEIKVGEKIKFKADDRYGYMIIVENAGEFLDIDSLHLLVEISGLYNRSYTSKPFLVEKKGTGEYFFRVYCIDKQRGNAVPSRILIKSEQGDEYRELKINNKDKVYFETKSGNDLVRIDLLYYLFRDRTRSGQELDTFKGDRSSG